MQAIKQIYSLEEYFELEKSADEKFEFWDGNVWSMSGASFAHNIIVQNLNIDVGSQLRRKGCQSFPSDMLNKSSRLSAVSLSRFDGFVRQPGN